MRWRALAAASATVAALSMTANVAAAQSRPVLLSEPRTAANGGDQALHGRGSGLAVENVDGPFQVCPVDRPRHYRDDFGEPRYAGGFHRHEGIDIFAPGGTPIRAPFDGKAEASASWAGGLQLYVYGREGFAFNAHLSRLGRTGRVEAGDVVGYVGNSGDAYGGSTHDHFEWHPHGGPAVDAFRSLNAACGPARSPRLTSALARLYIRPMSRSWGRRP